MKINFINGLDSIGQSAAGGALAEGGSWALGVLGSLTDKLFGRKKGSITFVFDGSSRGGLLRNIVKSAMRNALNDAKDMALSAARGAVKSLFKEEGSPGAPKKIVSGGQEKKVFISGIADESGQQVTARDVYGYACPEALMLAIPVDKMMTYDLTSSEGSSKSQMKKLVWWDCTAALSLDTEKNVILTRVTGRDYSRKELVSNGDISFSVTGNIVSPNPGKYPTNEVKKFVEIMQYKGIVEVSDLMLDTLGIKKILIKGFSMEPPNGYKNIQKYTFTAVGIQPESEVITDDSSYDVLKWEQVSGEVDKRNGWIDMLKNAGQGMVEGVFGVADQALSDGIGVLGNTLDR